MPFLYYDIRFIMPACDQEINKKNFIPLYPLSDTSAVSYNIGIARQTVAIKMHLGASTSKRIYTALKVT